MPRKVTNDQHLLRILADANKPLENYEVRQHMMNVRPGMQAATVDAVLCSAARRGLVHRKRIMGSHSKFQYVLPAGTLAKPAKASKVTPMIMEPLAPSTASVVYNLLNSRDKIDSRQVFTMVQAVLPRVKKSAVDSALHYLVKSHAIKRSKNPMTDSNVTSDMSRFSYFK